jgi:hypothetical protein
MLDTKRPGAAGTAPGMAPNAGGTPCWTWMRAVGQDGYGRAYVDSRMGYAHRVIYEQHRGPVPEGLQLDHLSAKYVAV